MVFDRRMVSVLELRCIEVPVWRRAVRIGKIARFLLPAVHDPATFQQFGLFPSEQIVRRRNVKLADHRVIVQRAQCCVSKLVGRLQRAALMVFLFDAMLRAAEWLQF